MDLKLRLKRKHDIKEKIEKEFYFFFDSQFMN